MTEKARNGTMKGKGKKMVWKKFLNMRVGIVDEEPTQKRLPPIKLDSKLSYMS